LNNIAVEPFIPKIIDTMRTITKYIDAIKGNIEFRVGQSAQENFDIIGRSNPDDIWFHISQASSCHVVATIPVDHRFDKKQLKKIAIQGAVLCKQNSKYKSEPDVSIMYTQIQHVEKTPTIGSVIVDTYKTVVI